MFRLIFILVLLFASNLFSQNVSGNVQDFLFNVPLEEVAVIVKNSSDGGILGTDSTDASGNYSIDYVIVGVNDNNSLPTQYYLSNPYPQPFNPSAKFDFTNPRQGLYEIKIYNNIGQLLYLESFNIEPGKHSFIVSGLGSAGIYLFNLSGKDFNSTQKLVLLDGGDNNVYVELNNGNSSNIRKTNYADLLIEFRKSGYTNKDTLVVWQMNHNIDVKIKQVGSSGSIQFNGLLTKIPTNTPGQSVTVTLRDNSTNAVICSTLSAINGFYTCNVNYNSYTNPNNPAEIIYSPSAIKVTLSGTNYTSRDTVITFTGNNLSWLTSIQQTLITRTADVHGQIRDSITQAGIPSAQIKVYKASNGALLSSGLTENGGYYVTNFNFLGYDDDPEGTYNNIGDTRVEASKSGYITKDTIVSFTISNEVYLDLPIQSYQLNAIIKLYNTKGDVITDLDSLKFIWPDGSVEMIPNSNGIVTLSKTLYTLNSDTTVAVTHNHPELYLNWVIGTTENSQKVEWLYQNETPWSTNNANIPLNKINNATTEAYMIPRFVNYGPDNNMPIDMSGATATLMLTGQFGIVSGFRPSQYDTTDIVQLLYNETTNEPMPQNQIDRANNEIQKFLTAVNSWLHKKLLIFRFTQIESSTDLFFLYLINPDGRNRENFSQSNFYNGGPLNVVSISLDGTFRIKNSYSKYTTADTYGTIQSEFFDSMHNTNIDGPTYLLALNISGAPYTDLARNLMGISLIMKPGTNYWEQ